MTWRRQRVRDDLAHSTWLFSFLALFLGGGCDLQVARRLRAMLENLLKVLPEPRRPVLLAYVSGVQGVVGGAHEARDGVRP